MDQREAVVWFESSQEVGASHYGAGRTHELSRGILSVVSMPATVDEANQLIQSGFWTKSGPAMLVVVSVGDVKVPIAAAIPAYVEISEPHTRVTFGLGEYWVAIDFPPHFPRQEREAFFDVVGANCAMQMSPPPLPPPKPVEEEGPGSGVAGMVRWTGGAAAAVIGGIGAISSAALKRGGDALKSGEKCTAENAVNVPAPVHAAVGGIKSVTGGAAKVTGAVFGAVQDVVISAGKSIGRTIAPAPKPGSGPPGMVRTVGRAVVDSAGMVFCAMDDAKDQVTGQFKSQSHGVVEHRYGPQAGAVALDAASAGVNCFDVYQNCGLMNPKKLAKKCVKSAGKEAVRTRFPKNDGVGGQGMPGGPTSPQALQQVLSGPSGMQTGMPAQGYPTGGPSGGMPPPVGAAFSGPRSPQAGGGQGYPGAGPMMPPSYGSPVGMPDPLSPHVSSHMATGLQGTMVGTPQGPASPYSHSPMLTQSAVGYAQVRPM